MIPRVFPQWVNESNIKQIFLEQQIGIIFKVIIVRMKDTDPKCPIYKAYIFFSVWFDNIIAKNFQTRLYDQGQARVVYDDPWFWTIFINSEMVLSKSENHLIRLNKEHYKLTRIVQKLQKDVANEVEKHYKLTCSVQTLQNDIANEAEKQKQNNQKIEEQNKTIQILQDFCIKSGLNIPFWNKNAPPSKEESFLETLSASTAVTTTEWVLDEDGFIPVKSYENDWLTENPENPENPENSRLWTYLN